MADLGPEEARAIVDPALELMIDAVQRYDGYIVQSTGDGVFALFGAPLAHEDHPQRAVYASLRTQEGMRAQAERLKSEGKVAMEARVGLNTGEVVMRTVQTGGCCQNRGWSISYQRMRCHIYSVCSENLATIL